MKRISLIIILLAAANTFVSAQNRFYTKTGKIFFECAKSSLEKIEATNKSCTCVLDTETGNVQFAVLMKGFEFDRALMQEHFNENYVESSRYPKSEFKGQITNNYELNYGKDGEYTAKVKGQLQIHGETKAVETTGKIVIKDGKVFVNAKFNVLLSDYNIRIPSIVNDKVANKVNIEVDCSLELFKY